jgi:hypothetical protein
MLARDCLKPNGQETQQLQVQSTITLDICADTLRLATRTQPLKGILNFLFDFEHYFDTPDRF